MLAGTARLPFAFGVFGVLWGAWQAVLPELAAYHQLSSGPLGAILTLGFAASLPAMLGAGRLLDRAGAGWGIAVPALVLALALLVIGSLSSIVLLVVAVVAFASGSGAYDVAINGAALGDESWSRPARLTMLHAAFSAGGVLGAIGGGLALGSGLPFQTTYLVLAVGMLLAAAIALSSTWRSASGRGAVPRSVARAMLPLAALAGLAFLAEGSMETWSAIYLRDVLGAGALVGALGPAAFHGAMFLGRLVGAGVAGRLGAPATLLVGGLMSVVGMAVALLVTVPAAAIPAMAAAALGASFVVPVVVSLAARRAGPHAGRAASYVLTLGYSGFLVGPSLVGIGGEVFGLRIALVVVPVAAAFIVLGSRTGVARP
ncbi:MAG: MFS transporter [Chloroflexi bacterium]|nr:MFS transporter [Chloroflexota bacterium]